MDSTKVTFVDLFSFTNGGSKWNKGQLDVVT